MFRETARGDVFPRRVTVPSADRAEHDSEFKAELFRLASGELPQTKRMLLAKAFSVFSETGRLGRRTLCAAG